MSHYTHVDSQFLSASKMFGPFLLMIRWTTDHFKGFNLYLSSWWIQWWFKMHVIHHNILCCMSQSPFLPNPALNLSLFTVSCQINTFLKINSHPVETVLTYLHLYQWGVQNMWNTFQYNSQSNIFFVQICVCIFKDLSWFLLTSRSS